MTQPLTDEQRRQCRTLCDDLNHPFFHQLPLSLQASHDAVRASLKRLADGVVPNEADLRHLIQAFQLAEGITLLAQQLQVGPRPNRAARRARR